MREKDPGQLNNVTSAETITSYPGTVNSSPDTSVSPNSVPSTVNAATTPQETPISTGNSQPNLQMSPSDVHMELLDILFPPATATFPDLESLQDSFDLGRNFDNGCELPNIDSSTLDIDGIEAPFGPTVLTDDIGRDDALLEPNSSGSSQRFAPQSVYTLPGQQAPFPLYQHPPVSNDSPEMVAVIFDRRICEVLCIKDSPAGNPWRVIIWPLAKEHAAVYHAVAAMTYFQWSNTLPQVRVRGMQHLQASIQTLALSSERSTPLKVSLTARLLLAFAESWYYPRSSCGSKHVHEAKHLLQAALRTTSDASALSLHIDTAHTLPLKFLAKTWLYMDVLTRITCDTVAEPHSDFVSQYGGDLDQSPAGPMDHVDPLMGCAEPLFPLLGRVADLVRSVRKRPSKPNSPAIVTQAVDLKHAIESWTPWTREDANSTEGNSEALTPMDSDIVQTAYAYKWAALLLLCQAVPELPCRLSFECVAQKILTVIATVPAKSKASIFHIFPLMIAGCDTTDADDRDWIRDRWQRLLTGGNSSGISERCLELTSEVWRRRDAHETHKQGAIYYLL